MSDKSAMRPSAKLCWTFVIAVRRTVCKRDMDGQFALCVYIMVLASTCDDDDDGDDGYMIS